MGVFKVGFQCAGYEMEVYEVTRNIVQDNKQTGYRGMWIWVKGKSEDALKAKKRRYKAVSSNGLTEMTFDPP